MAKKKLKKNIRICNLRNDMCHCCYEVPIGRGTPLGNPFYMSHEGMRDEICDRYAVRFKLWVAQKDDCVMRELDRLLDIFMMYGKLSLFCFCAPKRCHGETIKEAIWKMYKEGL